jgi:phosphohistidine phosphatase
MPAFVYRLSSVVTMHLYFVRHGLAHWPNWPHGDAERPLTPRGCSAIEAMSLGLARRQVAPDWILHSPLARAQQTAEIIARALGRVRQLRPQEELAPGFGHKKLAHLLEAYGDCTALMLVGHNPDMGDVVNRLTDEAVSFAEGAVACVKLKDSGKGKMQWYATAEELAAPC